MTKKLFIQAIVKFFSGIILVGLLVFLPAGTLHFINGWIFIAALFIPMFLAGIVMMLKNPSLLKSRLDAKEKQKEQSLVVKFSGLMFLFGFIVAGLNFRFSWHKLPDAVVDIINEISSDVISDILIEHNGLEFEVIDCYIDLI